MNQQRLEKSGLRESVTPLFPPTSIYSPIPSRFNQPNTPTTCPRPGPPLRSTLELRFLFSVLELTLVSSILL